MDAQSFKDHLQKVIIPFWNQLKDEEFGGFYGYVEGDGTILKKEVKGVILNSRILWFYSQAYIQFMDDKLLEMARHAYDFLVNNCIDTTYGGVYWSLNYKGEVEDDIKHCYNQAFAIYALSTYYEACGDKSALSHAYDIFNIIENKCHDDGGYLEAFYRDFTKADNDKLSENGVLADRTMNTLLHVLEAYTQLYKVDCDKNVGESLRAILDCFNDKVYNPEKKMCEVFFDMDYNSIIDLDSYGHDIEASWLINCACDALNDAEYSEKMLPVIMGLAYGCYNNSMDEAVSKKSDSLAAMNMEIENGVTNKTKVWWIQAEAVTGYYNAYERDSEKIEYKEISEKVWNFIQKYVVDEKHGEWVENIEDLNNIDYTQALAQPWKCPYHNGRMCLEMMRRLER